MKYNRTYNFSAGPAMMPEPVLEEIRDEMMNYRGSGMCVMEMSHRSKVFQQIIDEADADLRDLMGIPDNYKVLFIQGGATLQFAAVPWNLMKNGKAVYIDTGAWSSKAIKEAKKYGVLYCVLKDNNAADGLTDIMVRAEDAGKINRIFERFGLATVDMASVKTEIQQSREDKAKGGDDISTPERSQTADDKLNQFLEAVAAEQPDPTAEPTENTNPTTARTAKSRPSERFSGSRDSRGGGDGSERCSRPSVREELREIRREQGQKLPEADRENLHIPVRVKKKGDKEAVL